MSSFTNDVVGFHSSRLGINGGYLDLSRNISGDLGDRFRAIGTADAKPVHASDLLHAHDRYELQFTYTTFMPWKMRVQPGESTRNPVLVST